MASWIPLPSSFAGSSVTQVAFDPFSPLLWSAGEDTVASFVTSADHGVSARYTKFQTACVNQISVSNRYVLTAGGTPGNIRLNSRGGFGYWSVKSPKNASFTATAPAPFRSTDILATGPDNDVHIINTHRGLLYKSVPMDQGIGVLKTSPSLCVGTQYNRLVLLDARTPDLVVERSTLSTGMLSQLDLSGSSIATLGYIMRYGVPIPEAHLKIYDARFLRPQLIPFPADDSPVLCRFTGNHQRPGEIIVASSTGVVQILNVTDPSQGTALWKAPVYSYLTAMDISGTGEGLALADAAGGLYIYKAKEHSSFEIADNALEFPDTEPEQLVTGPVDVNDPVTFANVRLPLQENGRLLSDSLGRYFQGFKNRPYDPSPQAIDSSILKSVQRVGNVEYAPFPAALKNQARRAHLNALESHSGRLKVPHFRSVQQRISQSASVEDQDNDTQDAAEAASLGLAFAPMPSYYGRVEIKYSKFGIEDFDFGFYNKTPYSGLEPSPFNAALQLLHYVWPIAQVSEWHMASQCLEESCVLCELGFLSRMLSDARGLNCQASNFNRMIDHHPRAQALGLSSFPLVQSTLSVSSLIQTFLRFVLEAASFESGVLPKPLKLRPSSWSALSQVLTVDARVSTSCPSCHAQIERDSSQTLIDLSYTSSAKTFASALESSLRGTALGTSSLFSGGVPLDGKSTFTIIRGVCSGCHKVQNLHSARKLAPETSPPPALVVNAAIHTADDLALWMNKGFLTPSFAMTVSDEGVVSIEQHDPSLSRSMETASLSGTTARYDLRGVIVQIQPDNEDPHLVSYIRPEKTGSDWYLFNDFLVKQVSTKEVLNFPKTGWKIPVALMFERQLDFPSILSLKSLPCKPDLALSLFSEQNVARNKMPLPINKEKLPKKGDLVAIDAEFVLVQKEQVQLHSSGSRKLIRPGQLSPARISLVNQDHSTLADDYIVLKRYVVDHLTEFSGIKPNDLDPVRSKRYLVPLKAAYRKMRALIDAGIHIVGHSLKSDLRIMNIVVPAEQILDTAVIYRLPNSSRILSLRFLAWCVLDNVIQSDMHDSIVDALTALRLYEIYAGLAPERWGMVMDLVEIRGQQFSFRVPDTNPPKNISRIS